MFVGTKDQHYWVILSDAEFKLYQQHHVLQVPLVKESSHQLNTGNSIRVWQTRYIT